jgi:UDP-N-acetylmuramoylalanine--D-glutamate ligase
VIDRIFSPDPLDPQDLAGRRITVMGLGLFGGGAGLVEFLCGAGARVTVTDLAGEKKLAPTLAALRNLPIRFVLGEHREEDFLGADIVFVNPAVPRKAPLVRLCRERGIRLETEMNLFFKLCPGRICAVTGSNGKTTTTRLIGEILAAEFPGTRVGGNLGKCLLSEASRTAPSDRVALEMSSFQLEDLASIGRRPEVSLITNVSPNHLDRHGTYEAYLDAKKVILEGTDPSFEGRFRGSQRSSSNTGSVPGNHREAAVLCGDDPLVRSWASSTPRRAAYYGRAAAGLPEVPGAWVLPGGDVVAQGLDRGSPGVVRLFDAGDLRLRGEFNLINAAGAAAASCLFGASAEGVLDGVRRFQPIPHRLELVHEEDGIEFYNDSIATTPESVICALEALGPRVVLIAGGSDKGSSFEELGRAIARRAISLVLIGKMAPAIRRAVEAASPSIPVHDETSLEGAVRRARAIARPGDRVVLSPACASFDMFANFEDRGNRFTRLVRTGREV